MEAVDPCLPVSLVPPGSRPVVKGKDQADVYTPLPSIYTPSGVVITRWTFTDDERARILRGEDVFIGVSTFHAPLQPLRVVVGGADWSEV